MRSARQREQHRAALDRRMEQLRAELAGPAGTRVRPPSPGPPGSAERLAPAGRDASTREPLPAPQPSDGGRHAARAAPRWELTPAHLRVVAVLVVLALLLTGWWLVRSRPEAVPREVGLAITSASPEPSSAGPPREDDASRGSTAQAGHEPGAVPAPSGGADPEGEPVVVHVAGRVRRPGIVRLPAGARVVDAVEAAGGARPGVALRDLNLARAVVDGEQVLVGMPRAAPAAGAPGSGGGTTADPPADPLVNLNTADQAELETLPGVGPVTAGKILAWREEHGRFSAVEELLEVDGIGDATLADLAPLVTV